MRNRCSDGHLRFYATAVYLGCLVTQSDSPSNIIYFLTWTHPF